MNTMTLIRSSATLGVLLLNVTAVHAQQFFEEKYVAVRADINNLVPLPTLGIVPRGAVAIEPELAAQLSEAMQKELDAKRDGRFEVLSRVNGVKMNWAFVVKNAPREVYDVLTPQFTEQLITCLHSLEDDVNIASLQVLLTGGQLSDQEERNQANAASAQMLANWKADQCATRQNDLPFIDSNRTKLTAATHGMLTAAFDPLIFRGNGLIDLTVALNPLYFASGGFWTTEMAPQLNHRFEAAVDTGFFKTTQTPQIIDRELRTFWDWAILVITTKQSIVRSFIEIAASRCIATVPELSNPFKLSRCTSAGNLQFVTLRVAGQDFSAVQRVRL
jgi:hypothetical protein